jgi:hypothetical protein
MEFNSESEVDYLPIKRYRVIRIDFKNKTKQEDISLFP